MTNLSCGSHSFPSSAAPCTSSAPASSPASVTLPSASDQEIPPDWEILLPVLPPLPAQALAEHSLLLGGCPACLELVLLLLQHQRASELKIEALNQVVLRLRLRIGPEAAPTPAASTVSARGNGGGCSQQGGCDCPACDDSF